MLPARQSQIVMKSKPRAYTRLAREMTDALAGGQKYEKIHPLSISPLLRGRKWGLFRIFVLFRNFVANRGFTIIELIIITAIIVILASVTTVNFQAVRFSQQLDSTARDLVSKIREIQTFVLSGKLAPTGQVPSAYNIVISQGTTSYRIDWIISGVSTTTLETVSLPQNLVITQISVNGSPRSPIGARIESPFGKITVDGQVNRTVQIDLLHQKTSKTRSVIIDGISGRISIQ